MFNDAASNVEGTSSAAAGALVEGTVTDNPRATRPPRALPNRLANLEGAKEVCSRFGRLCRLIVISPIVLPRHRRKMG